MSVRDLISNNVVTALGAANINSSALTSAAIDLSKGTTGSVIVALDWDGMGGNAINVALETSADGTTWVTDDGSTGNKVTDADNVEIVGGDVPEISDTTVVVAQFLNPIATNRYARVVVTESGADSIQAQLVGVVGPKREA